MERAAKGRKLKSKLECQNDSSLSSHPQSSSHEREVQFPFYIPAHAEQINQSSRLGREEDIRDFCARLLTFGTRFEAEWWRFKLSPSRYARKDISYI